jgi:hypothetical protein
MGIAEGLGALKTGFEIAHAINQRVKEGKLFPNEIADQLLHLQQLILDSQRALNDAAEEIRNLREQVAASKKLDEMDRDLEWIADGGFWVRKSENEAGKAIAYCPLCWGDARKLVPLNPGSAGGHYFCPIHKSSHSTAGYRRRLDEQMRRPNNW